MPLYGPCKPSSSYPVANIPFSPPTATSELNTHTHLPRPPTTQPAEGSTLQPTFWGYSLTAGLLSFGQMLLENKRLAVVFDLDETLLQALTEKTLRERIAAADEKL